MRRNCFFQLRLRVTWQLCDGDKRNNYVNNEVHTCASCWSLFEQNPPQFEQVTSSYGNGTAVVRKKCPFRRGAIDFGVWVRWRWVRIRTGAPDTTPEDNLKECKDLNDHRERLDEEDGDVVSTHSSWVEQGTVCDNITLTFRFWKRIRPFYSVPFHTVLDRSGW